MKKPIRDAFSAIERERRRPKTRKHTARKANAVGAVKIHHEHPGVFCAPIGRLTLNVRNR